MGTKVSGIGKTDSTYLRPRRTKDTAPLSGTVDARLPITTAKAYSKSVAISLREASDSYASLLSLLDISRANATSNRFLLSP